MKHVSLEAARTALVSAFGEPVLIDLIQIGPAEKKQTTPWVFDAWGNQLPTAWADDQWLLGREDEGFFSIGKRDEAVAPWGQPEVREEPTIPVSETGTRIVGTIRVDFCAATGRVRINPTSTTRGAAAPGRQDRNCGTGNLNRPRISGEVHVIRRDLQTELPEKPDWETIDEVLVGGDARKILALAKANLLKAAAV